jgi:hypothetical protein
MKESTDSASGNPRPRSADHCPNCGYPCCGGAEEHVEHGGKLRGASDDDPIESGLAAARYENVFGRRPGTDGPARH